MFFHMRTTINLPDPLYRELKQFASEHGRTVTDVIHDSVCETLLRYSNGSSSQVVDLPVLKGGSLKSGVSLDCNSALLDLMDEV